MNSKRLSPLKIGIIGAGFSGTALAAALHKYASTPLDIILFEKTGLFGAGDAYKTPFAFHLLNARTRDMSAFEDDPAHFINWIRTNAYTHAYIDKTKPIEEQFVPRLLYGHYLKNLLHDIGHNVKQQIRLILEPYEVLDIVSQEKQATLILSDKREMTVDKVILSLGNPPPCPFPFPVANSVNCIANPWNYTEAKNIPKDDPVLIVGTGLSMIDTVLTLHHQQHQGEIYAVSRHGLLPLPHHHIKVPVTLCPDHLPYELRTLTKLLRSESKQSVAAGGDWRAVVNALRPHIPSLWETASLSDKKRFLRHVMPYWNIHRHRVPPHIAELLTKLTEKKQFKVLGGRIQSIDADFAKVKLRGTHHIEQFPVKWVVNCLGPSLSIENTSDNLIGSLLKRGIASLEPLNLGFTISTSGALQSATGDASSLFYTLGTLRKGASWEASAVPEIRKQCFDLANYLLKG